MFKLSFIYKEHIFYEICVEIGEFLISKNKKNEEYKISRTLNITFAGKSRAIYYER